MPNKPILLEVKGLRKHFPIKKGFFRKTVSHVKAVDDVDLFIREGETLGLVGESGCGKTTVGRTILRLIEPTAGRVVFSSKRLSSTGKTEKIDITAASGTRLKALRREMQIIFQDPYSSLDPRMCIGRIVGEGLNAAHGMTDSDEREERIREMMQAVGLKPEHILRYPHEFSGGQRQRIGIARALAPGPRLVVADEPVSALDVSIRAQVTNLLLDLQSRFGLTYLFIGHDLSVVKYMSDRVAVMYLGRIVELAPAKELFANPRHPYTEALMSAVPVPDPDFKRKRIILEGDVPSPVNPPSGCYFHPRCRFAEALCRNEAPLYRDVGDEHFVTCHLAEKLFLQPVVWHR
jgi:peptide/nickel transport system ATP-binding protein